MCCGRSGTVGHLVPSSSVFPGPGPHAPQRLLPGSPVPCGYLGMPGMKLGSIYFWSSHWFSPKYTAFWGDLLLLFWVGLPLILEGFFASHVSVLQILEARDFEFWDMHFYATAKSDFSALTTIALKSLDVWIAKDVKTGICEVEV